jgi:hypothetical protein
MPSLRKLIEKVELLSFVSVEVVNEQELKSKGGDDLSEKLSILMFDVCIHHDT